MKSMGLAGVIRGKPHRTTFSEKAAPCPLDRVNRDFKAPSPNVLWVSDFTYVATWKGFVYVAFVVSLNLRRRHMSESQRAMVAAKIANIDAGTFAGNQHVPSANLPTPQVSQSTAADLLNVS